MKTNHTLTHPAAGTSLGWLRLASCAIALVVATAAFARSEFSSIVVFGDSLSDTGRLFHLTNGEFPPRIAYFHGRQSNGPVWVEYLADELRLEHRMKNYAVNGAMTGPTAAIPSGNVKSDVYPTGLEGTSLSGQLAQYLAEHGGRVDPDALYIVEGGANDLIRPIAALLMNPPATELEFQAAVSAIAMPTVFNTATIVGTLKAKGAKYIAVVNVPDFGKSPYLIGFGPQASYIVSWLVELVNGYVAVQLTAIDSAGGNNIARIDMYGCLNAIVADPARYGFTQVTGPFMTLDLNNSTVTYASAQRHAVRQWLFWDDLHPTTRGHQFLAENARETLRAAFPAEHAQHDCHSRHR